MQPQTLYDKLWHSHVVKNYDNGTSLIYIDRHLLHEVTSPQAFEGLRLQNRKPWRIDANIATVDHNVPTTDRELGVAGIQDQTSKIQIETLDKNCDAFGILEYRMQDLNQGIVHIIGPELGATLPGMTVVCGDSHTSTHGAFAALAHGIGTSEVEHALATQTLVQKKMKNMRIEIQGRLKPGVYAKDLILYIIGKIGTAGATGHALEFAGEAIRGLSMEGRMTLCNMAIEAGARVGLVAVDQTTVDYIKDRPFAPQGALWEQAVNYWKDLVSDQNAPFDKTVKINAVDIKPQVSWGTSPEMVVAVDGAVPDPETFTDQVKCKGYHRALEYMDLKPGQLINSMTLDRVFIGSCTNARIEDLRVAAKEVRGKKVASSIKEAIVVPGSGLVKKAAEEEGLDKIFIEAGFEWRAPGCSMCLAMNPDKLLPGEHCASTSNRNFEGRQGTGGRTHLVSPATAARAAVLGRFGD